MKALPKTGPVEQALASLARVPRASGPATTWRSAAPHGRGSVSGVPMPARERYDDWTARRPSGTVCSLEH